MSDTDPERLQRVEAIFRKAPFLENLGVKFLGCGPGWCESGLQVQNYHKQQNRLVHAGVLATLADHTAGAAAGTLIAPGEIVLTVEFKINLLRPGKGQSLRARAQVLKPGRRLSVVESEVFAKEGEQESLVAKATVTLAVLADFKEDAG